MDNAWLFVHIVSWDCDRSDKSMTASNDTFYNDSTTQHSRISIRSDFSGRQMSQRSAV